MTGNVVGLNDGIPSAAVLRRALTSLVNIRCVDDLLDKILSELEFERDRLGGIPQQFLGTFIRLSEHAFEFIQVRSELRTARGAVETWVFLEPNQRLLGLLAALRALDGKHVV